ncbi:hypothetical protein ACC778_32840 [Rhizobium ruizarguesonis]
MPTILLTIPVHLESDAADHLVDVLNLAETNEAYFATTADCLPLKPLMPIGAPSSIARIKPFASELGDKGFGTDLRGEAMYVVMLILVKNRVTPPAAH